MSGSHISIVLLLVVYLTSQILILLAGKVQTAGSRLGNLILIIWGLHSIWRLL